MTNSFVLPNTIEEESDVKEDAIVNIATVNNPVGKNKSMISFIIQIVFEISGRRPSPG